MSTLGIVGCCAGVGVFGYIVGFIIGWMTHADMVASMSECERKRKETKEGGK